MIRPNANLDDVRSLYATMMVASSGSSDPRLGDVIQSVHRETFLPPGPWTIMVRGGIPVQTPTSDPIHLYQNVLVSLDIAKSINNGEPQLHAAWLGAAAPKPNEAITHIGAGTGYYSAILSKLALPNGIVTSFEIVEHLADDAKRNLAAYRNVIVRCENAAEVDIPPSDLIYVNAGVVVPPKQWLLALHPGGRLIFPWRPTERLGLAAMIVRHLNGFELKPLMHAWFIPCAGVSSVSPTSMAPDYGGAWRSKSVRFRNEQAPDESATAVYNDLWFSDRLHDVEV